MLVVLVAVGMWPYQSIEELNRVWLELFWEELDHTIEHRRQVVALRVLQHI